MTPLASLERPAPGLVVGLGVGLVVGLVVGLSGAPLSSAGFREVASRPGGVVRWQVEGVEVCGRGAPGSNSSSSSRTWPAYEGACWFPIDLLEPRGEVEVFADRSGIRQTATIRVTEYPYPVQRITLKDPSKVDLSPADLARVRREQAQVGALWSLDSPPRFELPLGPPLKELGAAGSFGSRRYFNDQPRSPHSGADFSAAEGVPVLNVAAGTVVLAADLFFSGQSVFIDHGGGLISMYFHLSSMSVGAGDELRRGGVVGLVGQTGRATGPHLHFGLKWRGARVDPSLLLGPMDEIPAIDELGGMAPLEGS